MSSSASPVLLHRRPRPNWWLSRRGRVTIMVLLALLAIEIVLLPRILLRPNPPVAVLTERIPARVASIPASEPISRDDLREVLMDSIHRVPAEFSPAR